MRERRGREARKSERLWKDALTRQIQRARASAVPKKGVTDHDDLVSTLHKAPSGELRRLVRTWIVQTLVRGFRRLFELGVFFFHFPPLSASSRSCFRRSASQSVTVPIMPNPPAITNSLIGPKSFDVSVLCVG
ncbi:hypothetical protein M413DRAFT_353837 [Hebeloma cylindrosporum]|uniref:Uncharacterized protein n=1 Tax=Hebeloma cylindrosporum TaxID=76867 RepID=A0A0C2Y3N6_HEBCY|nr:hypothetical protein M413DRAFT_353837 [Hebeloma cylindrosporum h7]